MSKLTDIAHSIYDTAGSVIGSLSRSTDPETVMAQNRVTGGGIPLSMNPDLFFYTQIKFYQYNRQTVYTVENDVADSANGSSPNIREAERFVGNTIVNFLNTTIDLGIFNVRGSAGAENETSRLNSQFQGMLDRADTQNRANAATTRASVARTLENPQAIIQLPLPNNLIEQYQMNFESGGFGLGGKIVFDALIRGGSTLQQVLSNLTQTGLDPESLDALITIARDNTINSLPEGIRNALSATVEQIKNPVQAAIFKGINLRQHSFSWKLIPESAAEQQKLMQIIDIIRLHSLPTFAQAGNINNIKYPDFCKIEMKPNLYAFPKPLFIQSVAINRAPDGFPSLHKDQNPVAYQIDMQLLEATAITREDISGGTA